MAMIPDPELHGFPFASRCSYQSPVMADKAAHFDRVGANQSALPLLL
ncbi:unnamed protein product [Penicillium camemberti]|uniref:Str. FM013 n=1 Tax=Penicillium camemberti (strain FM 013) TaxID=1429867 RepID=A0A0G4P670_PENC3|nr:unnamed protein product [Penicillium camemberti]